jgi:hypothetical protein
MIQDFNGIKVNTSNNVDLANLKPELKGLLKKFILACNNAGMNIIIVQGFRSIEYQNGLYAIGRTKPGSRVTNCVGGTSPHNYGEAFDFAPLEKNGTINWSTTFNPKWKQCIKIAESMGLRSGKNFRIVDMDHLELPMASEKAVARYNATKAGKTHIKTPAQLKNYTSIETIGVEKWGIKIK